MDSEEYLGLKLTVDGQQILRGINLEVKAGEVHAIMGPNGSGKSTLASVIAGREEYNVTKGEVEFLGNDILDLAPEDRAREGLFLAFQYPVEIPGVSSNNFLRTALNQIRAYRGLEPLDAVHFLKLMKEKMALVDIHKKLINRSLNEGFSGGEKKRNEIFLLTITIVDGVFSFLEALLCIAGLIVYLMHAISIEKKRVDVKRRKESESRGELRWKTFAILVVSAFFIFIGAKYTVESVIRLSELLNIGKEVIAASAVALGTSMGSNPL